MGDDCMGCRKWEEEIYWSRFATVQFCQTLGGRFHHQLTIPQKFVKNLREKLGGTVTLKGPSGYTWDVELILDGDMLFLRHGWEAFIDNHLLEEGDILVFKYNGDSKFDVSMFDQRTMCEKEASYFVKRCTHAETESVHKRKKNVPEDTEDTNESSDDVVDYPSARTSMNEGAKTARIARLVTRTNAKGQRVTKSKRVSSKRAVPNALQLTSRRRPVTEEEKEKAQQLAVAAATDNSFIVVMRPSHVYRGFYMSIPAEWAKSHLKLKSQDVILRLKENTWKTKYHSRGYGGGLTGGWKSFVLDNFLEEFDVCLFDLGSGTNAAVILDVSIFRVVEEVIPPYKVTPGTSRGRVGRPPKLLRRMVNEEEDS